LEVANVICWEDERNVRSMAMAMRPWPVVALFQARMRARTRRFSTRRISKRTPNPNPHRATA
jgi:hypothetical protein